MAQIVLPKEIIEHSISFEPIVAPHSTCIKKIIQKYENDRDEELEPTIFLEFLLWNKYLSHVKCSKLYWFDINNIGGVMVYSQGEWIFRDDNEDDDILYDDTFY
jgi:hypothetical protein